MNEAETRAELIDPALKQAGWGATEGSYVRRELSITDGRLQGMGKRAKKLSADYVLEYRNQRLAVIEAKKRSLSVSEGVAQAKQYASMLQLRFTYSTNGEGIYQIDMKTGEEKQVATYPTPEELWNLTFEEESKWRDEFANVPFEDKGGQWQPRYYQDNAIKKALEAISQGKERILLNLATGTGKTSIAFQISWKLFQSRWSRHPESNRRPRILFLADRNILADQAYNSFSAFDEDARVRIEPKEIRKKGAVPKNANIFFTIFQTFMSGEDSEGNSAPYFGDYPEDFFDFIIVDECHRGGANDESSWRGILEYFSPAVQLGLTATPKRKGNVDTYAYFGDPVYTYSLKEGINDGFLTPFRVQQIATTLDEYVYTPDDDVIAGEVEEGKRYGEDDFNKVIEIPEREKHRVKLFMKMINQKEKTIVFCATQAHALAVRDYINQIKQSQDPNYCVRVTANDGEIGETFLRTFQDNEKTIPTILTTSQKLSTGVDARNVRNIVLMRPVKNIIEFKQIVGRGTRLFDGKDYFTIYDFVKAYKNFEDPEWDGEPIDKTTTKTDEKGEVIGGGEEPTEDPITGEGENEGETEPQPRPEKIRIKLANGKERTIQHMTATTFWGVDGKPISAAQFVEQLFGDLPELFKSEDELREIWSNPETRTALLESLSEKGYGDEQLEEMKKIIDAENSDIFDVLAYIAFEHSPITREERVNNRKQIIFSKYQDKQQEFIDFVLSQYVTEGVGELQQEKLSNLLQLKYNGVSDAAKVLGSVSAIREVFSGFQKHLYEKRSA